MQEISNRSGGVGLERSCGNSVALSRHRAPPSPPPALWATSPHWKESPHRGEDWIRSTTEIDGVELWEAWFHGSPYHKHRHDTYAISLTETGVQAFSYRGATYFSTPGMVVVLHPDEVHDGYAGADSGFGYRQLYVEPARIFEAVRLSSGRACSLPFLRDPVVTNQTLATAIRTAFQDEREPLALDDVVLQLADGLIDEDPSCTRATRPRHLDVAAVERARDYLAAEKTRVVRSWELEAITGLTRFDLARQFRAMFGTSPYRYLLMRRLEYARQQLSTKRSLAAIAFEAGFADQAHFTRAFTGAFGITPGRYAMLSAA